MSEIIEKINNILAMWNPIGVDSNIALDEYRGYIPLVLKHVENRKDLEECLERILISKLEVGYDPANEDHIDDLKQICDEIIQVYKSGGSS